MRAHKHFILIVAIWSLWLPCVADSTVLYDSISGELYSGGSGFNNIYETGDEIALDGGSGIVSSFGMTMMTIPRNAFRFNFYSLDKSNIGSLLWSSPQIEPSIGELLPKNISNGFFNYTLFQVDVPEILVPQRFVWTIEQPVVTGAGHVNNGLNVIGRSGARWVRGLNGWERFTRNGGWGYAAQISGTVVSEPSIFTLMLIGLAGLGFLGKSKWENKSSQGRHYRSKEGTES